MTIVDGIEVFTDVADIVRPAHTALVVIDVQHDFCSPGGIYAQMGRPVETLAPTLQRMRSLSQSARASGGHVIYLQNTNLPAHKSTSAPCIRYRSLKRGYGYDHEPTIVGTWGWQVLPEVGIQPDNLVVTKHRSSGFAGTDLNQLLRLRKVQSVVLCGVTTDGCVESTARAAEALDYYVVVVSDACAAFPEHRHEESLNCMRYRYNVVSAEDLLRIWRDTG